MHTSNAYIIYVYSIYYIYIYIVYYFLYHDCINMCSVKYVRSCVSVTFDLSLTRYYVTYYSDMQGTIDRSD